MKAIFTLHGLFTFLISIQAQYSSINNIADINAVFINVPSITFSENLPVSHIKIVDFRDDTLKVGYINNGQSIDRILIPGNTANRLEGLINNGLRNNLDKSKKEELVIILKHLWIKGKENNPGNHGVAINNSKVFNFSKIYAVLEVFLHNDNYYIPLFRIDKTFASDNESTLKENLLALPFLHCLKKFILFDLNKMDSSRKFAWLQIEESNKRKKQLPILSHLTKREKGLFLIFNDFKENNLSKKDFVVEHEKLTSELYIIENGEKKLLTDIWGYCDGKKYYIRYGFSFYELFQNQYTFEFIAHSHPPRSKFNTSADAFIILQDLTSAANYTFLKLFELNMSTGKPY